MSAKKIVVTGASGFVGQNLSTHLTALGYEVQPLSLRAANWKENLPTDAFAIVHLAGLAHDLTNTNKEDDYFRVNTDLTIELYKAFQSSTAQKFFYFSSVKAVADSLGSEALTEDYKANPKTAYGKSKRLAEEHLLNNPSSEKECYILRPCMIHGPGNKGNLNLLYKVISKGIPYPFAAFENSRSFVSIDNVNFAIGELCENKAPSGVYNLADDEALSTTDLIGVINEGLGKKGKSLKISKGIVNFMAKIGDVVPIPFNSERLKKLTESYVVSNKKIVGALGKPFPVSTREGLLKTIKSFN